MPDKQPRWSKPIEPAFPGYRGGKSPVTGVRTKSTGQALHPAGTVTDIAEIVAQLDDVEHDIVWYLQHEHPDKEKEQKLIQLFKDLKLLLADKEQIAATYNQDEPATESLVNEVLKII